MKRFKKNIWSLSSFVLTQMTKKQETFRPLNTSIMHQYDKHKESGRSMVEMLGVLAIMGILSVGTMMGYRYAIDKHRTNETVSEITLRFLDLIQQSYQNQELSLSNWEPLSTGYEIKEVGWTTDNYIYMDIDGMPKSICKMFYDSLNNQDYIVQIDINSTKAATNELCSDDNLITLYLDANSGSPKCWGNICFGDELNDETLTCTTNDDCPECVPCTNGICTGWISGTSCDNGNGTCHRGRCAYNDCQSNKDCQSDEYCSNNAGDTSGTTKYYKCKKMDFTKISITLDNGTTETWYASKNKTSWWDAHTICDKLRASLPSPEMLVNNFQETFTAKSLTPTDRLKKLFEKTNFDRIWSNFSYPKHVTDCECGAMSVNKNGAVNQNFKNNTHWVVCK